MNDFDNNHEPTALDDVRDRLVDVALEEVIGGKSPTDLSARVLAEFAAKRKEATHMKYPRRRYVWVTGAVAAILLIGASALFLPRVYSVREARLRHASHRFLSGSDQGQVSRWPKDDGTLPESRMRQYSSDFRAKQIKREMAEIKDLGAATPAATVASADESTPASLPSPFYLTDDGQHYAPAAKSNIGIGKPVKSTNALIAEINDLQARGLPAKEQMDQLMRLTEKSVDITALAAAARSPEQKELLAKIIRESSTDVKLGLGFRGETAEGAGPGNPGDQYTRIFENPFVVAQGPDAVSTFSIDVDTASYANVRQFLQQMNTLPPPDAVRIEELINYFDYNYGPPISPNDPVPYNTVMANAYVEAKAKGFPPFAAHVEIAGCPWQPEHRLVRIGIKGREMARDKRPKSNLVFLVDVSGSMDQPNKLPLVVEGLAMLTRELGENDRVAIVVYASSEGLVLPSTPGSEQQTILDALGRLQAGGSTAGGAGIQLAYQIAEDNFIEGGTNRVILCTDGDFNVGVTSTAELQRLCEQKAKDTRVFLSVLGFGRGNLNDAMMEALSNRGNGNYAYVDNRTEARRVLVNEMTGTLVTIAKDVKIQVEFNPAKVAGYRLIGYENRMLRTEDFNDDKKDAGEIGAGHTVTALYEIVPAGKKVDVGPVDDLKYQETPATAEADDTDAPSDELLTLKMRYKEPTADTSKKLEWPVTDDGKAFAAASPDFQFATAVAGFGHLLRDSQYKGNLTYGAVLEVAQSALGEDKNGYRAEFVELVRKANSIRGE